MIAAGLSAWMGRDGNYWGHNAIIRTEAFARYCGLPDLRGTPPLGGHILSHDFVEAALMRRAGYAVYMLPTLGGSYEESPPSLIDLSIRDRRWCQGNLQHIRVLFGARLSLGDAPAFPHRHLRLSDLAAVAAATAGRHRAGVSGELFPAGIFHFRIHAVSGVAAFRRRTLAGAVRTHHGHSARAEAVRPHRRDPRSGHAPRLRRRRRACWSRHCSKWCCRPCSRRS